MISSCSSERCELASGDVGEHRAHAAGALRLPEATGEEIREAVAERYGQLALAGGAREECTCLAHALELLARGLADADTESVAVSSCRGSRG